MPVTPIKAPIATSGAPPMAALSPELKAVMKSKSPLTSAAIAVLVLVVMSFKSSPSLSKMPCFCAK